MRRNELLSVRDGIRIEKPASTVFRALTDARELACWWPRSAESDPREGGRLVLHWFTGAVMETTYEVLRPGEAVGFVFGPEHVRFDLVPCGQATRVDVEHSRIDPAPEHADELIHIAQTWAFLMCNLKCWLDHGLDLRGARDEP